MKSPLGEKKNQKINDNPNFVKIKTKKRKMSTIEKNIIDIFNISLAAAKKKTKESNPVTDGNEVHDKEKKNDAPCRRWHFTLNNPTREEYNKMMLILKDDSVLFNIVSYENGQYGASPHFQGYFEFHKAARPIQLFGIKRIHFMKAKAGRVANVIYVMGIKKEYELGIIVSKSKNVEVPYNYRCADIIRPAQFYPWQHQIYNVIRRRPHKRAIIWVYERLGCLGKTELTKFLVKTCGALRVSGNHSDICHAIANYTFDVQKYPPLILVDIPRSEINNVSYPSLECMKDFIIFSGKYNSQALSGKYPPHVIVFSNFLPEAKYLSKDRWLVLKIDKYKKLKTRAAHVKTLKQVSFTDLTSEEINRIEKVKGYNFLNDEKYIINCDHKEPKLPKTGLELDENFVELTEEVHKDFGENNPYYADKHYHTTQEV